MKPFALKIVTPDGPRYDGMAEEVIVRTTTGDMGILAGHINTVAPLGMGAATFVIDGKKRYAACIGGMVSVMHNSVNIIATTFEWSEDIDRSRANAAEERAKKIISAKDATVDEVKLAQVRLRRALIRKSVSKMK